MKIDHKQSEVQFRTIQPIIRAQAQTAYMEDNRNTPQMKLMNSIQQSNEGQTPFVDNRITPQIRLMKVIQCMEMEGGRLQMKPTVQLKSEKDDLLQGKIEMLQQKPNKTGLPDNLKSGVESMSGFSMDDVRVHYNSDKPAQMQAHAYAQGTDIHIASGQEKHLPHEAWHVVQQKQGRVQPTMQMQGVGVNNDSSLEREADVMGEIVFQKKSQSIPYQMPINISSTTVQRYLKVGEKDFTEEYAKGKKLDVLVEEVLDSLDRINPAELAPITMDEVKQCRLELSKWISDDTGVITARSNPVFGRKIQIRNYKNYMDLRSALLGWVRAKEGRIVEKKLARNVIDNVKINALLTTVLTNIYTILTDAQRAALSQTETEYFKWFNNPSFRAVKLKQNVPYDTAPAIYPLPQNVIIVLQNPDQHPFRTKISAIHDLMIYCRSNVFPLNVRDETYLATTGTEMEKFVRRPLISQIPYNAETRKGCAFNTTRLEVSEEEASSDFKFARLHNIPMYGRHSLTSKAMANLTKYAAVERAKKEDKDETISEVQDEIKNQIKAVAYSIMALWRVYYDHRSMPYHTLHEVMDVLSEFGIGYNPSGRYEQMEADLGRGGMFGDEAKDLRVIY